MLSECFLEDPERALAFYPGKETFARAELLDVERDAGELEDRFGEGRLGREREGESARRGARQGVRARPPEALLPALLALWRERFPC
jgi:hypothetical protein